MAITSYGSIGDDVTHNSDVEADQDQVNRDRDNSQTEYTSLLPNGSDESTNNTSACCSISSPKYKYILGVILSLVSGILFTGNNFLINQWQVSVSDTVLVRCVLTMSVYTVISLSRGESLLPGSVKLKLLIILQGTLGAVTFIAALSCVSYMQVPDALCIIFACPVVTIAASAIMLRDKINLAKILAGIFLLFGVVLACKPPFLFNVIEKLDLSVGNHKEATDLYYIGVILAVTSCLAGGIMDVLIAKCGNVSTSVLVNWSAIAGFVMAVVYCQIQGSSYILSSRILSTTWTQWATYIGLSISGLFAFTTLTKSLQLISPNLVASLRCLELVLAFSVQSLIDGEFPDFVSVTGGLLITFGVIILAFQDEFLSYKDLIVTIIKDKLKPTVQYRAEEYDRLIGQTDEC